MTEMRKRQTGRKEMMSEEKEEERMIRKEEKVGSRKE